MTFDAKVPQELKDTQKWFASIITRPLDINDKMIDISPTGKMMSLEASHYIVPSKGLQPDQRIQIYNQQYWWRLLNVLHENFPLTARLFGFTDFDQMIGYPYLVKYPPFHWSLNLLGSHLQQWVEEEYSENDKKLVLDAVKIDYAYNETFFAEKKKPIDFSLVNPEELSEIKLTLQPHVRLFELDYDLFKFRFEMLKMEPEHWLKNDFPVLDKGKYYFILFRNFNNYAVSDPLSATAFLILKQFQKGASIDDVCEWLETQDEKTCDEALEHMQKWFQDWAVLQIVIPLS